MENNEDKDINVNVEVHKWPDEIIEEKKTKRNRFVSYVIVSVGFFIIGMVFSNSVLSVPLGANGSSKFDAILRIMSEDWYFGKDIDDVSTFIEDNGFYGMSDVAPYDLHTTYMSREEMSQYSSNLSGSYVGIGVQYYASDNNSFVIQRVFPNSPAAKAGIEAGDIIVKVDGQSVEALELSSLAELVLGEEGSKVVITVSRNGQDIDKEVTRAKVLYSTFGEVIDNTVGYIELDQFGESTAEEVYAYLEQFENNQKDLIVDLRDNGGGYLDSVVDIVSYFVPKGETVLITESKNNKQTIEKTNSDKQFQFENIVILINGGTASASEVFTAALAEHLDNVTVVGVNSYGKGTVQQTRMFEDQSALKYTTAEWLTPSGKKIHGVGIAPDIEMSLHDVLMTRFEEYPVDEVFKVDSVGTPVKMVQDVLDFLGYNVDRRDGYFDVSTKNSLIEFQKSLGLTESGEINEELYEILMQQTIREWNINRDQYDTQLDEALRILGVK